MFEKHPSSNGFLQTESNPNWESKCNHNPIPGRTLQAHWGYADARCVSEVCGHNLDMSGYIIGLNRTITQHLREKIKMYVCVCALVCQDCVIPVNIMCTREYPTTTTNILNSSHVDASFSLHLILCLCVSTLLLPPCGSDSSQQWNCEHRERSQWAAYGNYSCHLFKKADKEGGRGRWESLLFCFLVLRLVKFCGRQRSYVDWSLACILSIVM